MSQKKRGRPHPSGKGRPIKDQRKPRRPPFRLKLYRDPNTQTERVALAAPLFEEDWQNGLALAAANTGLEMLRSSLELEQIEAFGEKMVNALSQFLDGILKSASGLACHAGCDHCCHQIVGATWPELALVERYVRALSEPQKSEVYGKVLAAAEKARALGPEERFSPDHPCPFLESDGRCGVYPVRPLACRGVHALDADVCREILRVPETRRQFLATGRGSPSYREPGRAVHSLSAGIQLCLSEVYGLDMRPVDLMLGFARLIEEPALLRRWLSGERTPDDIRAGHGTESPERAAITGEVSLDPPHK